MTPYFRLILVLTFLGPFTITTAQEFSSALQSANGIETSAASQDESSATNLAPSVPGFFGQSALSNFNWSVFPGADFFGEGSRQKRATWYRVRCNYRRQGRAMCLSCTTARHCNRNNRGREIDCSGEYPYCRYGRCSKTKGYLCDNTTTTTTEEDET
ncbi:unnamed protein product [Chrysodeixis includens]|uniref:Uncharacterized protein n=1 Tax=Chrysodeixis includens TaxID=689277 RepID=A0A9P0BRC1_CHRIL|nr:unnamed protein product [Chrysodeixis includens]